jgi:MFS transporter, DHA1 family, multidrug resistance protein
VTQPAAIAKPAAIPFLLLVGLSTASPFAMNSMLPALPAITRYYETSYGVAQLALTLSLVSFGLAQLFLGPLADRYGRRPVMLIGFSAFVVGSIIAAAAPTITIMILGRIIQAAGGSAGLVLGRTIAHDVYGRSRAASVIGYLTMAMALAQMLAPWAGGIIEHTLHWRAIFWLMAASGAVLFAWAYAGLVETRLSSANTSQSLGSIAVNALSLLRERNFLAAAGNMAFTAGIFFAFVGTGPHIVQEILGRTAMEYGLWCILPALGYSLGNYVSGRLSERFGPHRMIRTGMILGAAGIALLWLLSAWTHPAALFLPMLILAASNGLTIPSAMAMAMNATPNLAGSAAGLSGALQMLVAAVLGTLSATFAVTSAVPMLVVMTGSFLLALVSLQLMER